MDRQAPLTTQHRKVQDLEIGLDDESKVRLTLLGKCAIVTCSSFVAVGFYSIGVALAQMQDHFAGRPLAPILLPMVGGIVPLAFAITSPMVGRLIGRFGIRTVLVASLLLLTVAGTGPLVIDNLAAVVALRALVGLGVAGILNAGVAGVALAAEVERPRIFGLISTAGGISGIVCFPLAGLLAAWNWRAVFAIPLMALAVLPFAMHLPKQMRRLEPTSGGRKGGPAPLALLLVAAFVGLATYAAPMFSPVYLREQGMASASFTALPLMAMGTCSLVVSSGYSVWVRRLGRRTFFMVGFSLSGVALMLAGSAPSLAWFAAAMALFGAALGCIYPHLNATAVFIGKENSAQVISKMNASLYGAQVLFPYLTTPVTAHVSSSAVFFGLGALSAVIALWIGSTEALAAS